VLSCPFGEAVVRSCDFRASPLLNGWKCAAAAKPLTRDEARPIAANAKLPELVHKQPQDRN
jgi:hypothetical protein